MSNRKLPQLTPEGEQTRIERTYKALEKVKGICKDPNLTNASTTINETLYGECGKQ